MLLRRMPTANRQASQRAHVELVNDIHNELLNEATLINERERKAAALQMLTKSALAQGKGGVELGTGSLGRKHSEPPNLAWKVAMCVDSNSMSTCTSQEASVRRTE